MPSRFRSARSLCLLSAAALAIGLAMAPAAASGGAGAVPVPAAPAAPAAPAVFPPDGLVGRLVNVGTGKCLEIADGSHADGARAQQWDCVGVPHQSWRWVLVGVWWDQWQQERHSYRLVNAATGKCLEIADLSKADGARAQQWQCANVASQIWNTAYASHRRAMVWNNHSDKPLEIADGSRANGARAQQWQVPYIVPNHMEWDF
ncbi:RICIN domain-containing protein (plasmid) [Streptomycetaceae bacterium NBC_01309]